MLLFHIARGAQRVVSSVIMPLTLKLDTNYKQQSRELATQYLRKRWIILLRR
jgi:hypothetical protein